MRTSVWLPRRIDFAIIFHMTAPQQSPSPLRIFATFNAYQQTAALRAACELDLFTTIGEGNTDPGALAKRCGASERGIRILCDYLTIIDLLEKQNGRYALAADSAAFLDRRSPASFASAASFLTSSTLTSGYADLAAAVRKGGVAVTDEGPSRLTTPCGSTLPGAWPP